MTFSITFSGMKITRVLIYISLKFVTRGPVDKNASMVQIMAWHRTGDKPLSKPLMSYLLMHICVTRPQWVKLEFKIQFSLWKKHLKVSSWNVFHLFLGLSVLTDPVVHGNVVNISVCMSAQICLYSGVISCIRPANERWRYIVTSSLIGWVHTKWSLCICQVIAPYSWNEASVSFANHSWSKIVSGNGLVSVQGPLWDQPFHVVHEVVSFLHPPHNEVVGRYIGFTPFVRPSISPSRIPFPLYSAYSSGWIHVISMHLIKQHQKVCRM